MGDPPDSHGAAGPRGANGVIRAAALSLGSLMPGAPRFLPGRWNDGPRQHHTSVQPAQKESISPAGLRTQVRINYSSEDLKLEVAQEGCQGTGQR